MLEIKITAAELAAAINNLATALSARTETTQTGTPNGATLSLGTCAAAEQEQNSKLTAPAAPATGAPVGVPTAPNQPTAPSQNPIPTAAPQYTLEMLATAGSALIDAGKMDQLMELLAKFGVSSLTDLAPNTYGAMAQELRALGAKI